MNSKELVKMISLIVSHILRTLVNRAKSLSPTLKEIYQEKRLDKTLENNMKYPIAIEVGNDGNAYGVVFPDVDGCVSAGETLDEAISNAQEALEGFFEFSLDEGEDVPQPSTLESVSKNPGFAGFVFSFIDIDITPYLGKSHKINVTLPELLIKKIDDLVATNPKYKSRSAFLAIAAMDELAHS